MDIVTKLQDGTSMEVRIREGRINEVLYKSSIEEKLLPRKDSEDIKVWLKDILKADVTNFKKILSHIEGDEDFFSYGKRLLDCEKNKKMQNLLDYQKECKRRLKQLEDVMNQYSWP
ncbi:MAG: hypothetical protein J6A04_00265 [Clostridia bacterium]|nr:hypothetical protein [Clostridia bacterium]